MATPIFHQGYGMAMPIFHQGYGMAMPMYYVYILWSQKSRIFYYGYSENIPKRLQEHNKGISPATAPHRPWQLIFYAAFSDQMIAKDFERYLKSGSGKAFAYKRLVNISLKRIKGLD
jgi:predicted GIY-YIG superfamily endonuclease